jgi:hypothetical protein
MSRKFTRAVVTKVAGVGVAVLLVAAFGAPALAKGGSGATPTSGPAPTATESHITAFGTIDDSGPQGLLDVPPTDGAPSYYIVAGQGFRLDVCFTSAGPQLPDPASDVGIKDACVAANGALPLSYNKDVAIQLQVTGGHTSSVFKAVVPKGTTYGQFFGTFGAAANGLTATVTTPAKNPAVTTVNPAGFDVLVSSGKAPQGQLTSITNKGTTAGACSPTSEPGNQVCADLLPGGAINGDGLLSLGLCDQACSNRSGTNLVQLLVGMDATAFATPATLIMKCDKSLCSGGAIKNYAPIVTLGADSPSVVAPDCPAKGTVGDKQDFCFDSVQSTRDNAGDTFVYVLFVKDAKVRFP